MITTIPASVLELGIDFEGYADIARNVGRIRIIPLWKREKILEEADKKLSKNLNGKISRALLDIANDREFYEIAGVPYYEGPPEGEKIFITAFADYLLRIKR